MAKTEMEEKTTEAVCGRRGRRTRYQRREARWGVETFSNADAPSYRR